MDARSPHSPDFNALKRQLTEALGAKAVLGEPQEIAPFLEEQRRRYKGTTPFVVRPGSTAEVATAVQLCRAAGVAIVPQGGNTGLVAGAVPFAEDHAVLLSLGRLNRVRKVDPADYSRSEEHTSELQSLMRISYAVFCLKKKRNQ